MRDDRRQRTIIILRTAGILLCAGLLYALIYRITGFGIPCPVHVLTGWKCPGCGVTRMCLALLSGDVREAFFQNRAVLLLLPALTYIAAAGCAGYIRRGDRTLHGGTKWCAYAVAGLLLAFGAVRNFLGW